MGSFEFKGAIEPTGAEHGLSAANVHAEIHAPFQAPHAAMPSGMEIAHAVAPPLHMPGAEAALAALPGAAEPISPLIQMIMRMPGHLGLLSSFFEALQNFILPHTDLLTNIDFGALAGAHADPGMLGGLEHPGIDLAALPADAHILQNLGHNLGDHINGMRLHEDVGASMQRSLNVSGTVDAGHPQFEGLKAEQAQLDSSQPTAALNRDGVLAGPGLSSVNPANHLAGVQRVFSQKLFEGGSGGGNMQSQIASSSTVPNGGYPSNMQASGSSFQTHLDPAKASSSLTDGGAGQPDAANAAAPAHGDVGTSIGDAQAASQAGNFGPSGGVSDTLGGRHLLAMNSADVAPPNLGQNAGGYSYDHVSQSPNQIAGDGGNSNAPMQGLKAKELSLNGPGPETLHSVAHHAHPGSLLGSSPKSLLASNSTPAVSHTSATAADPTTTHATNSGANSHSTSHPAASVKGVSNHDVIAYRSPNHVHVDEPVAQLGDGTSNAVPADHTVAAQTPGADAASASEVAKPATFTIRAGDCLWNIAKNNLGDATRWQDLYKLNLDKIGSNPDLIHPGVQLQMPDGQSIAHASTDATNYTVQHGDNLWNLSKKFLGNGERWGELYKLNHDVIGENPRLILPGQELKIPGAEGSNLVAATGTPGDSVTAASAAPAAPDAVPQTPPAHFNASSPPQAEFGSPAPQAEAPTQSMAPPTESVPVSMAPTHTLSGPGGAEAATISAAPASNTLGQVASAAPSTQSNSVVSPSLAPDLSFFQQPANKVN